MQILFIVIAFFASGVLSYGYSFQYFDKNIKQNVLSENTEVSITPTSFVTPTIEENLSLSEIQDYLITETPTIYEFSPTPLPTSIPTLTPTKKPSPTPTPRLTSSATSTPTVFFTPTPTSSPTLTPTILPLITPTPVLIVTYSSQEINGFIDRFGGQYGVDVNVLRHIAICESGFRANAINGPYVGLYQFSASTWSSNRSLIGEDTNVDLRLNAEEAVQTAAYMISIGKQNAWQNCLP